MEWSGDNNNDRYHRPLPFAVGAAASTHQQQQWQPQQQPYHHSINHNPAIRPTLNNDGISAQADLEARMRRLEEQHLLQQQQEEFDTDDEAMESDDDQHDDHESELEEDQEEAAVPQDSNRKRRAAGSNSPSRKRHKAASTKSKANNNNSSTGVYGRNENPILTSNGIIDGRSNAAESFKQHVQLLRQFHQEHGHFRCTYPRYGAKYKATAAFLGKLRMSKRLLDGRTGKKEYSGKINQQTPYVLTAERIQMLSDIGLDVNTLSKQDDPFPQRLQLLQAFRAQFGHACFTRNCQAKLQAELQGLQNKKDNTTTDERGRMERLGQLLKLRNLALVLRDNVRIYREQHGLGIKQRPIVVPNDDDDVTMTTTGASNAVAATAARNDDDAAAAEAGARDDSGEQQQAEEGNEAEPAATQNDPTEQPTATATVEENNNNTTEAGANSDGANNNNNNNSTADKNPTQPPKRRKRKPRKEGESYHFRKNFDQTKYDKLMALNCDYMSCAEHDYWNETLIIAGNITDPDLPPAWRNNKFALELKANDLVWYEKFDALRDYLEANENDAAMARCEDVPMYRWIAKQRKLYYIVNVALRQKAKQDGNGDVSQAEDEDGVTEAGGNATVQNDKDHDPVLSENEMQLLLFPTYQRNFELLKSVGLELDIKVALKPIEQVRMEKAKKRASLKKTDYELLYEAHSRVDEAVLAVKAAQDALDAAKKARDKLAKKIHPWIGGLVYCKKRGDKPFGMARVLNVRRSTLGVGAVLFFFDLEFQRVTDEEGNLKREIGVDGFFVVPSSDAPSERTETRSQTRKKQATQKQPHQSATSTATTNANTRRRANAKTPQELANERLRVGDPMTNEEIALAPSKFNWGSLVAEKPGPRRSARNIPKDNAEDPSSRRKSARNVAMDGAEQAGPKRTPARNEQRDSAKLSSPRKDETRELISDGAPEEVLGGGQTWPEGWTRKVYVRKNCLSAGRKDAYWFSPAGRKFRSMPEVREFLAILAECNGNEEEAISKKLKLNKAPPMIPSSEFEVHVVKVGPGQVSTDGELGLHQGHIVTAVKPELTGKVFVGDEVVKVHEIDIRGSPPNAQAETQTKRSTFKRGFNPKRVQKLVSGPGVERELTLFRRRQTSAAPSNGETRDSSPKAPTTTHVFDAPPGKLELIMGGELGPNKGHTVNLVNPSSPLAGKVQVGDELIQVNDTNLKGIEPSQMRDILRASSGAERKMTFLRTIRDNQESLAAASSAAPKPSGLPEGKATARSCEKTPMVVVAAATTTDTSQALSKATATLAVGTTVTIKNRGKDRPDGLARVLGVHKVRTGPFELPFYDVEYEQKDESGAPVRENGVDGSFVLVEF